MNSVLDARGIFRIYIHFRTAAIGGRYVEERGNSIVPSNPVVFATPGRAFYARAWLAYNSYLTVGEQL